MLTNRSPCRLNESTNTPAKGDRLMETATVTFERMDEATKGGGLGTIRGVAGEADYLNKNRRYYPLSIVTAAIEAAQPLIEDGRFLMLAEHPDWNEPDTGELDDVAARITRFYLEGTVMHYEAVVINNEAGQNAAALMQAGVRVGASTRATGSGNLVTAQSLGIEGVDPETEIYSVNALTLLGVDLTLNPSVSNTTADLTESQMALLITAPKEEKIMDLNELKAKHPDLVSALLSESQNQQQSASVEAELARLKAENDQLKTAALNSIRTGIVTRAMNEADLPKLGNAGEINLDERFQRQVEQAALNAESDAAAASAVNLLITERRALLNQNRPAQTGTATKVPTNRVGLPAGNVETRMSEAQEGDSKANMQGVNSARAALGI